MKIQVEESALDTLKAMAQKLQEERDELLSALRPFAAFAKHFPAEGGRGNRPTTGTFYAVASGDLGEDEITVEDFNRADDLITKCTSEPAMWENKR